MTRPYRSSLAGFLIASALLTFHPDARSQDVRISSRIECKLWVDARAKDNAVNYEHYLQGFLDGFSLGSHADFWGTSEANRLVPSDAFFRLDDYCKTNPNGTVLEGAFKVVQARRQELTAGQKGDDKKKR